MSREDQSNMAFVLDYELKQNAVLRAKLSPLTIASKEIEKLESEVSDGQDIYLQLKADLVNKGYFQNTERTQEDHLG